MEETDLVFDPFPADSLTEFVSESLIGINHVRTGHSDWHPVNYFLRTNRGEILGGLLAYIWGGWLHVTFLWVSETVRGRGQGTRLMDAAETMARERGACAATLETFSFQAPEFYRKRGYTVCGQIEGYPPGHTKFFLRKDLG